MAKQTFEQWFSKVSRIVGERIGLSAHDLPDQPYRDWYDDGVTPSSAASRAIRGASE